jgi:hypothetical protein
MYFATTISNNINHINDDKDNFVLGKQENKDYHQVNDIVKNLNKEDHSRFN